MVKKYLLTSLLCLSLNSPAFAGGIPVYDASTFTQMVTQLNQMSKDYQKQLEQLEQAVKQANAMTGTRDMGSFYGRQNQQTGKHTGSIHLMNYLKIQ